ncbi:DNA glycosylase [Syncephalis plumigaleata]|nr:DNA glycosylase [Syncephalis plumigaleata]
MQTRKRKVSIVTEVVEITKRKAVIVKEESNGVTCKKEETLEKQEYINTMVKQEIISSEWHLLPIPDKEQLSLRLTLTSGQSFRWQETSPHQWSCVLDRWLYTLRQSSTDQLAPIYYRIYDEQTIDEQERAKALTTLIAHLRLDIALTARLAAWSARDANFAACLARSPETTMGVRILRLTPAEALISFICSSNNHVSRISGMVQRLCKEFGRYHATIDDTPMYSFPLLADLAPANVEQNYITSEQQSGELWLDAIKKLPYTEAKAALVTLPGIGPKVADCICLFGLDMPEAVPIDTHIWRIAQRDYGLGGQRSRQQTKALSAREYDAVGDCLRSYFGMEAGWAHSFLFTSELRKSKK